jgi:DNA polymerase I-like protein with 3'-5' exonuclease and polymerase domains
LFDFIKAMDPTFDGTEEFVFSAYDRYFERYTGIAQYIESQRELAETGGFVETAFGLHRTLNITQHHGAFDEDEEYVDESGEGHASWKNQAINTSVQGTAHQLLECGLINIRRKPGEYKVLGTPSMDVHDALYFMVNVLELREAYDKARYLLEKESLATVKSDFPYIDWKVPITTECEAGLRLGGKVVLEEGKFTIGSFLLDWYKITKKQIVELHEQLKVVPEA